MVRIGSNNAGGSGGNNKSGSSSQQRSPFSVPNLFIMAVLSVSSYQIGKLNGISEGIDHCDAMITLSNTKDDEGANSRSNQRLFRHIPLQEQSRILTSLKQRIQSEIKDQDVDQQSSSSSSTSSSSQSRTTRLGKEVSKFASGILKASKEEFMALYPYGVPVDPSAGTGEEDVLILYSKDPAMPSDPDVRHSARYHDTDQVPAVSAAQATENCDALNVVLTNNPGGLNQCLAIVGNYESYHVQRWMRVAPSGGGAVDHTQALRHVSRGRQSNGREQFSPPTEHHISKHWKMLRTYLNNIDAVKDELRPIAEAVAKDNTIVVLTCNMGQSELLLNFACSARARGLDISNVLVFATDAETRDLAIGIGMAAWYDEKNFGDLPTAAATRYGDRYFVAMMYAKVVCVQVISMLGYDLLFQDVDVVWYRNPLEYFHNKSSPEYHFDMYFQDDGAHSVRYAPYSANSGFYYVRNNKRTQYFFTALLYAGDLILLTDSHQQAMVALLAEHSSLFGLRVKVLERNMEEFPGGFHYHRRKDYMRQMIGGTVRPYIFHMSWTHNKDNKLKFFQQMGDWYLQHECISKRRFEILKVPDHQSHEGILLEPCCAPEPIITCHYRDKPSKVMCKDSPTIDAKGVSFW